MIKNAKQFVLMKLFQAIFKFHTIMRRRSGSCRILLKVVV